MKSHHTKGLCCTRYINFKLNVALADVFGSKKLSKRRMNLIFVFTHSLEPRGDVTSQAFVDDAQKKL